MDTRLIAALAAATVVAAGAGWALTHDGPAQGRPGQAQPAQSRPAQENVGPRAMPMQGPQRMQQRSADMHQTMEQIRTTRNERERLTLMQRQVQNMHVQLRDMNGEMQRLGTQGGADRNTLRLQSQMRDMLQIMDQMLEQQRSMLQDRAAPPAHN